MIINYPTYYLIPAFPLIPLYEVDNNLRYNDDYSNADEYGSTFNIEENEVYNSYRNINEDTFYEVDNEYVNENIK